jgi:hypothetical protein
MHVLWLLLPTACLPQDDLESYSRAWQSRPAPTSPDAGALGDGSPADASAGGGGAAGSGGGDTVDGGSGGERVDGGDAGPPADDAGTEPSDLDASTGTELDAGATPGSDAAAP